MKKPRLAYQLEKAVAQSFKRTHQVSVRFDDQLEQITLMESVYGSAKVLEDFEVWAETADKGCRYPMSDYLKVVDERLGQVATEEEDQRITRIAKVVYEITNDIVPKSVVKRLLEKMSVEDIEYGFQEFTAGWDEVKMKTAIKKFFQDGGAEAVIQKLLDEQ
jgi:hypothetical protein